MSSEIEELKKELKTNKIIKIVMYWCVIIMGVVCLFLGNYVANQQCLEKNYETFLENHCVEGEKPACVNQDQILKFNDYLNDNNELNNTIFIKNEIK